MNEGGGGIAQDLVNKNIGTLTNGAFYGVFIKGRGISFDGSNDFINLQRPQQLFSLVTNKTLTFTVGFNTTAVVATQALVTGGSSTQLLRLDSAGKLYWLKSQVEGILTGNTSVVANKFYVASASIDSLATANIRLYLDGKADGNTTSTTTYADDGDNWGIGVDRPTQGNFDPFSGFISFVYIHNYALPPSYISSLYSSPYQFIIPPSNNWWKTVVAAARRIILIQ